MQLQQSGRQLFTSAGSVDRAAGAHQQPVAALCKRKQVACNRSHLCAAAGSSWGVLYQAPSCSNHQRPVLVCAAPQEQTLEDGEQPPEGEQPSELPWSTDSLVTLMEKMEAKGMKPSLSWGGDRAALAAQLSSIKPPCHWHVCIIAMLIGLPKGCTQRCQTTIPALSPRRGRDVASCSVTTNGLTRLSNLARMHARAKQLSMQLC
eukprot:1046341-Pelagomonas_calceolata.AAC.2